MTTTPKSSRERRHASPSEATTGSDIEEGAPPPPPSGYRLIPAPRVFFPAAGLLVLFAYVLARPLMLVSQLPTREGLPVAMALVFVSLFIIVSRRKVWLIFSSSLIPMPP